MTGKRVVVLLGCGVLLIAGARAALRPGWIAVQGPPWHVETIVRARSETAPTVPQTRVLGLLVYRRKTRLWERFFPPSGSEFIPRSPRAQELDEGMMMTGHSVRVAEVVALRRLGLRPRLDPTGVAVLNRADPPASDDRLQPGDLVLAVEGHPTRTPRALRVALRAVGPGRHVFTVLRDIAGAPRTVVDALPADGRGFELEQDFHLAVPPSISIAIDTGSAGGPSAGLAMTLQILQRLGVRLAPGHTLAVTGTIGLDGQVGPIGGISVKTAEARAAHADVLVVPAGVDADNARTHALGMQVIAVRTLDGAVRALTSLPRRP